MCRLYEQEARIIPYCQWFLLEHTISNAISHSIKGFIWNLKSAELRDKRYKFAGYWEVGDSDFKARFEFL